MIAHFHMPTFGFIFSEGSEGDVEQGSDEDRGSAKGAGSLASRRGAAGSLEPRAMQMLISAIGFTSDNNHTIPSYHYRKKS